MIEEKVLKTNLSTQVVSTNKCVVAMQLLAGWSVVFIVVFNYHHILSSSLKGDAVAVEHHPFITTTMRLHRLSEHIQSVLQRLQHPTTNCTEAKLLISQFYPGCGFGCTFHHISHCLLIASSSNRTLVFKNDGAEWNYKGGAGLMDIFQPFSSCKYNQSILSNEPIVDCKGPSSNSNQADRLVHIPDRWNLKVDKEHTFPVVPRELVGELAQLHQNPPAWFFAQIMKFLWKMNAETQKFIDEAEAKIPFDKGPLVGIHVRRTDKILEAKYWELKDYMQGNVDVKENIKEILDIKLPNPHFYQCLKWIDLWYDQQADQKEVIGVEKLGVGVNNSNNSTAGNDTTNGGGDHHHLTIRRLFIATDEPTVLDEAKHDYGQRYEVFSSGSTEKGTGYNIDNLRGFISDLQILVRCDFVVCTFSSNVCRLIYELKQLTAINANEVHSLDTYPNDLDWPNNYGLAEFPWDAIKKENMQMATQMGATSDGILLLLNGSSTTFLPAHWFRNASFPIFRLKEEEEQQK